MNYENMKLGALKTALLDAALKSDLDAINAISQEVQKRGMVRKVSIVKDEAAKIFAAFEPTSNAFYNAFNRVPSTVYENAMSLDGGPTDENPTGISRQTRLASKSVGNGFRVVVLVEREPNTDEQGKIIAGSVKNAHTAWTRPETEEQEEEPASPAA